MKKVLITKTTTVETEHIYPIHCYYQSDFDEDRYAKVTDTSWTTIRYNLDGGVDYSKSSHNEFNPVPEWVLNNLCEEKIWLEGLKEFKNTIYILDWLNTTLLDTTTLLDWWGYR